MEIPVRMHHDMPAKFSPSDLPALFEFRAEAYQQKRSELAGRYADMLISAGIEPSEDLLGLRPKAAEPVTPEASERVPELAAAS